MDLFMLVRNGIPMMREKYRKSARKNHSTSAWCDSGASLGPRGAEAETGYQSALRSLRNTIK